MKDSRVTSTMLMDIGFGLRTLVRRMGMDILESEVEPMVLGEK
jgi:hypothetical protein